MNSIPCDVVLSPTEELSRKTLRASKQLQKHSTLFTLEMGKCYPHISIYMLQLKVKDLAKASELLTEIAAKTRKLSLAATRYHQTYNYFDAEYQKTEELKNLQQAVVDALNPIRFGMRESDKSRMQDATGLALENFMKYGWNTIGELYRPHLTLTRFVDEQHNPERNMPSIGEFSGQFPSIGLFEMGKNGTSVRKIFKVELSSTVAII